MSDTTSTTPSNEDLIAKLSPAAVQTLIQRDFAKAGLFAHPEPVRIEFSLGLLNVHGDLSMIAKALPGAQMALGKINKDKTATVKSDRANYSYSYSDLASVLDAVLPAFNAAGIAILQPPSQIIPAPVHGDRDAQKKNVGKVQVTTILLHESGAALWGDMEMTPSDTTPQATGSAITYARRYSLLAFCGAAPEDDDGANASRRPPREERDERPAQQQQRPAAQQQPQDAPAATVEPSIEEVRALANRAMLILRMGEKDESYVKMIAHVTRDRAATAPVAAVFTELTYSEAREALRLLRGKVNLAEKAAAAASGAAASVAPTEAAPPAVESPSSVDGTDATADAAAFIADAMGELATHAESSSHFCTGCGGPASVGGDFLHKYGPLGDPCHEDHSPMAEQQRIELAASAT